MDGPGREREIRQCRTRSCTSRGPQCVERRHGTAVRPISRGAAFFVLKTDFPRRKVGPSEYEESPVTWKTTPRTRLYLIRLLTIDSNEDRVITFEML
jgi:hypothetical protein